MPSGGQISTGVGLQLQANYPGTGDNGNWHITGSGLAEDFLESNGTMPYGNHNQIFGYGWNPVTLTAAKSGNVGIATQAGGFQNQIGDVASPNNPVSGCVVIGLSASGQNNNCISIGPTTNTFTVAWGGVREGGNIAIGLNGTATTLNRVFGATYGSVAVGKNAFATGDEFSIMLGTGSADGSRSICIGYAGASNVRPRAIMIDTDGAAATAAGQIQIGNNNHTGPITIGPLNLRTGIQTAAAAVNDADYNVAANIYRVQFTAISAARVVNFPAANSVPRGTRISVLDASGSCSAVNTITPTPAGADTMVGGAVVMITAYAFREFESDGVSQWVLVGVH